MRKTFLSLLKRIMIIAVSLVVLLIVVGFVFMQQAKFGKAPSGARLERLQQSPHYKNGQFHNESHTPALTEGANFFSVLSKFMFARNKNGKPNAVLPSRKVDLHKLAPNENVLVWFGHSSYFIQLDGKKILVDPVLSGSASPVNFTTKSFNGSDVYTVADIPAIDYLFISHDHWDHLDHKTIIQLKPKVKKIITGLGVGAHLEHWGFDPNIIIEKDWNEAVTLEDGFSVHTAPARHFSGRGFKRNGTLWVSFILATPHFKIYIGGDSGYDRHFEKMGVLHGPFDLAILESGQYDKSWKYIHMMPEEVVQAAKDLKARKLMAVHWGKFTLANHDWDEPIKQVSQISYDARLPLLTPMIGEAINLDDSLRTFDKWWETVK